MTHRAVLAAAICLAMSVPVAAQLPPLVTESDSGVRTLKYSTYSGTWAAPAANGVTTGFQGSFPAGPLHWQVARTRPDLNEQVAVFVEDVPASRDYLYAAFWDGANWDDGTGGPTSDAHNFQRIGANGSVDFRSFDVVYEQQSSEVLVVSGINSDESVNIWVYDGATWSGNLRFTPFGNGVMPNQTQDTSNVFDWVRLAERPGSNDVAFIGIGNDYGAFDSAAIHVAVWDGDTNTFGSKLIVSFPNTGPDGLTPQNFHATDAADIDFVLNGANAGEAIAVWGTDTEVWANIWNDTTGWAGNRQVVDLGVGNTVRWIRQSASPVLDDVLLAIEDVNEQIYTIRYDADLRTFDSFTATPLTSTAFGNADFNRPFDIVWDTGSGANDVILVYSDTSTVQARHSSDAGASWGAPVSLTPGNQAYWLQLDRAEDKVVHLAVHDNLDDLGALRWDGTSWTATTPSSISTNLEQDANRNVEAFALAVSPLPATASLHSPLSVTDGGTTLTVTANSFELVFDSAAGGSITEYYDLALDPTRTYDLAGGVDDVRGLLHMGWSLNGTNWYKTTEDSRGKIDLLEATGVRVKVRSRAFFEDDGLGLLPGLTLTSDHSVHASGRIATDWLLYATENHTIDDVPLGLGIHYNSNGANPLNHWSVFSESGAIGSNGPTDDFILIEIDESAVKNDFLHIGYEDWTSPPYQFDADVTNSVTLADWVFATWRDQTNGATMGADTSEDWQSLTYLKPTHFVDHTDAAVTERNADYRTPDALTVTTGTGWNENPADADFFNESEAAYTLDADPATGLVFDMDGSVTTRHNPFIKVRQWRSLKRPVQVTLEGTSLAAGSNYLTDVKPIARSYFAQDPIWYSTLQGSGAVTTPDIGVAGTVAGGATFASGRYGNGVLVDQNNENVNFGVASFDVTVGTVGFWMRPNFDHTDGARHTFWFHAGMSGDFFLLEKTAANNLEFGVNNGAMTRVQVLAADYDWFADEWVHLRVSWNEAGAPGAQLQLWMNGVELPHTDSGFYNSAGMTSQNNIIGNTPAGTSPADAILDEFYLYDGSAQPNVRALGGLTAANEFLASGTNNITLALYPADPEGRTDYFFFGSDSPMRGLNIALATTGVGAVDLQWEYWNGTSWQDLEAVTGFTDELNNLTSSDGTVYWTADPPGWTPYSVGGGPDLYYVRLHNASGTYTTLPMEGIIKTDILLFQYCGDITLAAQTFDFTLPMPTAVDLVSFNVTANDEGVLAMWETASELDNIGFDLYRSSTAAGHYQRVTPGVVPGLGTSPAGASYSFQDRSVARDTSYFYQLEDIDRSGTRTRHDPVFVYVPAAPDRSDRSPLDDEETPASRITYGRPEDNRFEIVKRTKRRVVVELATEGFHVDVMEDGRSRIWVPGYEDFIEESLAVPVKRVLLNAVVGRQTKLGSVRALEKERFSGLPALASLDLSLHAERSGAVRPRQRLKRRQRLSAESSTPNAWAKLTGTLFQGDSKKAGLALLPVRYDHARGELVLTKRLRVELRFDGRAPGEHTTVDGRARKKPFRAVNDVWVRLVASEAGLYSVRYEDVFGPRGRRKIASVRLSRRGRAVFHHVEPAGMPFGPGSTLYFVSEGHTASPYGGEAVYELGPGEGLPMATVESEDAGPRVVSYEATSRYEENRYYQAGLVNQTELWMWDVLLAPTTKEFPFELADVVAHQSARIRVRMQGISDTPEAEDHHLVVRVNGSWAGDVRWDGSGALWIDEELSPGVLTNGVNVLSLENAGDTAAPYSMVMLDRFEVRYSRALSSSDFDGRFARRGTVAMAAGDRLPIVVRESGEAQQWVRGAWSEDVYRFGVDASSAYHVFSRAETPEVRVPRARLLRRRKPVTWIAVAPTSLVEPLKRLARWRASQGIRSNVVALEDIYDSFGHGEASPDAVHRFIRHAYHEWGGLQYVVLAGDATYDPKGYLELEPGGVVPSPTVRTSYLWTASDPTLAAVNGDDPLPDVAVGRLPASTAEELQRMVDKIITYERTPRKDEAPLVLVSDNPDSAGDFGANASALAAEFGAHHPRRIAMDALGVDGTRSELLTAWNDGASMMSYIGHGAIQLWAHENIFGAGDVDGLAPSARPPIVLTMNCLNGFFHFPHFDALSEKLVKADGRGAIAAFSPSGLSLNDPAHQFHRYTLDAILSGRHERLGDAVLEAQARYAASGAFAELLSIYHLFGDPALQLD